MKKTLNINNKFIQCDIEGNGPIDCLVVGAAGLFKNKRLSSGLEDIFTFHFIDFFEESNPELNASFKKSQQNENVSFDITSGEIELARQKLGLSEIAVLGQSAGGAIAIEYGIKYATHCFLAIPIAFSPNWKVHTESSPPIDCQCSECNRSAFSTLNDQERKNLIDHNLNEYAKNLKENKYDTDEENFKQQFFSSIPLHFEKYTDENIKDIVSLFWKGYHPNISRVSNYFKNCVSNYNFFHKHKKLPDNFNIFWMLGYYDHSAPFPQLTIPLLEKEKKSSYSNQIEYYITISGHYPMLENKTEFNEALRDYIVKKFPERLAWHQRPAEQFSMIRSKL